MTVQKGDIIQITDETHDWFPALLVVSEAKSFGCQAYAMVPVEGSNNIAGRAYIRLETNSYEKVGAAQIVAA